MPYNNDEQHFIREKIKDKPLDKKQLLHKGITTIGYAVLFGFVSCLVFCALRPIMETWFEPGQEEWVKIPKDSLADGTEPDTKTDDNVSSSNPNDENASSQQAGEKNQTVYITERIDMTLDDYQILQDQLYQIGNRVNRSVVTVTGVKEGTDIFDSPYEATGQASGLIIGNSNKELLVLTEYEVIQDVKSIRVTFINNDTLDAKLKKYDGNTGIAVLGVPVKRIAETTMKQIEVAVLGNSLHIRQGKIVVALGSPLGTNYSILTGNITSAANTITTEDRNYTVFTTNIVANARGNGVVINTNGEVIGLFLKSSNIQKEQNTLTAVSISELKDIIELLSNGVNIPYIGIKGSTVTDSLSEEYGMPKGVYIKETALDSPAMTAGLQTGDVIVGINKEAVASMEDYQKILMTLKRGEEAKITVNRQSGDGYKKYTCKLEIGVLR